MNKNLVSNNKIIFFMSLSNIFIINLIGLSRLFNRFNNSAWIVVLIMIFFNILFCLPFKGLPRGTNLFKRIKDKYILRILLLIFLFFSISFNTIIVSLTINKFFYFNSNILITSFAILLASLVISRESFNSIINFAIVLFILIIPFYIIPFTHLEERDFSLVLPIYLKISDLIYIIPLFMFPLEHLIHGIFCDQIKNGFSRKTLLLSCLFEGIYIFFIMLDAQTLVSANFYVNMYYPGVFRWLVYQGNKFIENYDIFLLIIIIITYLFKLTYYLHLSRKLLFIKSINKNYIFIFISAFLLISLLYIYNSLLGVISVVYLYFSLGVLLILYIYFIYLSHKKEIRELENGQTT